jgi:hypothetical protein
MPRNLLLLAIGLAVAALTVLISWRLGFFFLFLPLFFFWSWGGRARRLRDPRDELGDEPDWAGPRPLADDHWSPRPRRRDDDEPPPGQGVDGEGI